MLVTNSSVVPCITSDQHEMFEPTVNDDHVTEKHMLPLMQTMALHHNSLHRLALSNNVKTVVAVEFRKVVTASKLKLAVKY